jgi:ATP-binding cassette subfamily C protein
MTPSDRPAGRVFFHYLFALANFSRMKTALALLLLFLLSITEGVGLLMLIPFLHLAGLTGGDRGASGLPATVERLFQAAGLTPGLGAVLFLYILILSGHALLRYRQELLNSELMQGFTNHLRQQLYEQLATSNWLFIIRNRHADFSNILITSVQRVGAGTQQLLQLTVTAAIALVQVTVALYLSIPMTLFALSCSLLLYLLLHPLNRQALRTGKTMYGAMQGLHTTLSEHLAGMKVAKSHGDEQRHVVQFKRFSSNILAENLRFTRLRSRTGAVYSVGAAVATTSYFYVAVTVVKIPAAELLLLVVLFARLLPRISSLQQNVQQLFGMLPFFETAQRLLADCGANRESIPEAPPHSLQLVHGIRLRQLCFSYSGSPPWTLDSLDLEIPAGSVTGVIGPSGAGKSTLADLLLGLLQPQGGEILIDGRPLEGETIANWRASIGYVPQETFLYHDTVRANLIWNKPDAGEDELWSVLRQAAADHFVAALPQGLDTVIGERGVRLSGGERQRLALARTLLRRPTLLLLDEATSSLDNENEAAIQQALFGLRGELTMVIIAHRLSTVRHTERIVVLEQGRVLELGHWRELSRCSASRFSRMLNAGQTLLL